MLARLHAACFDNAWTAVEFASLLAMPGVIALTERADGELRGFIMIRYAADEAEIITIGVLPRYRGRRIAQTLLAAIAEPLAAVGVVELFIEVDENNHAAQSLYRRVGFVECGRRRGYYQHGDGTISDALAMRCALPYRPRAV